MDWWKVRVRCGVEWTQDTGVGAGECGDGCGGCCRQLRLWSAVACRPPAVCSRRVPQCAASAIEASGPPAQPRSQRDCSPRVSALVSLGAAEKPTQCAAHRVSCRVCHQPPSPRCA